MKSHRTAAILAGTSLISGCGPEAINLGSKRRGSKRGFQMKNTEGRIRLKLLLRPLRLRCFQTAAAEELRQLPHVQRVEVDPERQEIVIWAGFPARGLLRDIVGVLRNFYCEVVQITFGEGVRDV